jgi:predicted GH43/DUF377 family glycosyl hydrolase
MKKVILCIFFIVVTFQNIFSADKFTKNIKGIVSSTFRIELDEYPGAFNPSLVAIEEGYILTFRYLPEPHTRPWISYIGAVVLNHDFKPINSGELLDIRFDNCHIPSQAEDARVFTYQGRYYLTYNDNPDVANTSIKDRRDIYIAQLSYQNDHFIVGRPIKLIHPHMYEKRSWEKNWMPFIWNDSLFLGYSVTPHEILEANLETGECSPIFSTHFPINWKWGELRGGTPPLLVDGEYLAFFHTAKQMVSGATNNQKMWHYFMGAYTFSAKPPFNITKVSTLPINDKSFYVDSQHPKRVIYPGGFVISGKNIYVAYGKDDVEIWIAVINKNKLINSLKAAQ